MSGAHVGIKGHYASEGRMGCGEGGAACAATGSAAWGEARGVARGAAKGAVAARVCVGAVIEHATGGLVLKVAAWRVHVAGLVLNFLD